MSKAKALIRDADGSTALVPESHARAFGKVKALLIKAMARKTHAQKEAKGEISN